MVRRRIIFPVLVAVPILVIIGTIIWSVVWFENMVETLGPQELPAPQLPAPAAGETPPPPTRVRYPTLAPLPCIEKDGPSCLEFER